MSKSSFTRAARWRRRVRQLPSATTAMKVGAAPPDGESHAATVDPRYESGGGKGGETPATGSVIRLGRRKPVSPADPPILAGGAGSHDAPCCWMCGERLIGSEIPWGTCGHCGGRSLHPRVVVVR